MASNFRYGRGGRGHSMTRGGYRGDLRRHGFPLPPVFRSDTDRPDHQQRASGEDGETRGYKKSVSLPMKLDTLKKLAEEDMVAIDVLTQITSSGGFNASLNVSEKPRADRFRLLLRILAKVSEVNVSLHRHALHTILEKVLNSKLFEWLQTDLLELQWKLRPSTDTADKENFEQLLCDAMTLVLETLSSMPGEVKKLMAVVTQIFNTLSSDQFKASVAEGASGDDDDHRSIRRKEQQLRVVWDDLIGKAQEIQKAAEAKSDRIRELEPLDNFRELPVFPREEEIMTLEKPRLRKNVVRGSYESVDHYLDIQFRLLREDFVWPIRDALRDLGLQNAAQGRKIKFANIKSVRVYLNATFSQPEIDKRSGLLVYDLSFDTSSFRRMNWQTSRRLTHGSLLCISQNNFQTVFFATIFERDLNKLKNGTITVYVDCPPKDAIGFKRHYSFIESPSFFEAYKPVLRALQNIRGPPHQDMPFERHLVFCDPNVPVPNYIIRNSVFNIGCLSRTGQTSHASVTVGNLQTTLQRCERGLDAVTRLRLRQAGLLRDEVTGGGTSPVLTVRDVRQAHAWPSVDQLVLDEWQFEAVQQALTRQITIIQGPPGTGKTYVGLKIARVLLEHTGKTEDDFGPMLLVCYTNHALDQFLEGIAEFMPEASHKEIVRIGGAQRIKEDVKKFQLRNFLDAHSYRSQHFSALWDVKNARTSLERTLKGLSGRLKAGPDMMLTAHDVIALCERSAVTLFAFAENDKLSSKSLILNRWLCKYHPHDPPRPVIYERFTSMLHMYTNCSPAACWLAVCIFGNRLDEAMNWIYQYQNYFGYIIENKLRTEEEVLFGLELFQGDIERTVEWLELDATATSGFATVWPINDNAENLVEEQAQKEEADENVDDQEVNMDDAIENQRDFIDECMDLYDEEGNAFEQTEIDSQWTGRVRVPDFVKRRIAKFPPLGDEQAAQAVEQAWQLPLVVRWQLYRNWHRRWMAESRKEIIKLQAQYAKETEKLQEVRDMDMAAKLKGARVIAMTTTGAAKKQALLQQLRPKIVVIEEAAEILEAHIVASLTAGCQHLILIGDHKQLRPNPSVYELAKHYRLDVSLFERLINNGFNHVMLREQHRMRPEIADPLMKHFYADLRNHSSVYNRKDILGMKKNVFFIDHSHEENDERDSHSHKNIHEVKFVAALCKYLLSQGYAPDKITILTCYLAQMFEIKKLLSNTITDQVRVCVVDNFQGEENDIILLSLVRSNSYGKIGFLSIDNRVCVALSRAKLALYVVGNFEQLSRECQLWKNIVDDLEKENAIGKALPIECQIHGTLASVATAEEFQQKAPDGGCVQMCNVRMPCGHVCSRRCHPNDVAHKTSRCVRKCERLCPNEHQCPELCYQACPPCKVRILKKLPCGHEQMVECHQPETKVRCTSKCEKLLLCGHQCPAKCGETCSNYKCNVLITKTLACGHSVDVLCSTNVSTVRCQTLVEKLWPYCEHKNQVPCSTQLRPDNCPTKCNAVLQCEHVCRGTCGQCRNGRLHIRCAEPCSRILICGHQCTVNCSAECPPCQHPCENRCTHSSCGRVLNDKRKKSKNRLCGQLCPPCVEKCSWRCKHHKCDLLCCEPCKVERCVQPCARNLKCKHSCIGVCGERCLKLCRICQPEKYEELLSSQFLPIDDEEKETAVFIQLQDCHHILEMTQLDQWFDSKISERENAENSAEISLPQCPMCKAPVRTSQRYGSVTKQLLRDVERVKRAQHGRPEEFQARCKRLLEEIPLECTVVNSILTQPSRDAYKYLRSSLERAEEGQLTGNFLTKMENLFRIAQQIVRGWSLDYKDVFTLVRSTSSGTSIDLDAFLERYPTHRCYLKSPFLDSLRRLVSYEVVYYLRWIVRNGRSASHQMINELAGEWYRVQALMELAKFLKHQLEHRATWNDNGFDLLNNILTAFFGTKPFTKDIERSIKSMCESLRNSSTVAGLGISERERVEILRAMNLSRGHWFKCPLGHVYAIGECGGAMQTSVCPECKSAIGGEHHRLLTDNAVATEMDGATTSAYGEDIDGDRRFAERLQQLGLI